MKHVLPLAALVAGALLVSGCAAGSSNSSPTATKASGPINVGMIVPLTGPYAPLGKGDKAAAEQMVSTINAAGGVDGRQIDLTVQDDKTDVTQSVTLFNQMAADKSVSAILSSSFVSASAAVGPSAASAKIPILALGPISAFANGSNKYAFTVPATPELYGQQLVKYFSSVGLKKLAIGYVSGDVYGQTGNDATKAAAKKAGIDVVLDEGYDGGATDFTPLITHVKASGADGFLVWGAGPAPVIITKQFQGAGMPLYMTGAEATSLYTQPAGSAANGVVIASAAAVAASALPDGPFAKTITAFTDPWEKANNGTAPPQFAFDGAAAIQLLVAAVKKSGSSDRESIRSALDSLSTLTVNGRYNYSSSDHSGLTTDDIAIVQVKDGAFVPTPFTVKQFSKSAPH
ncbi:MAG TPA: ABC transporter substrate-binding protein [Pseudolysinimonas sp.]|nr:ABC transporter substrate-binding protein [Pseudolysinimonas sp.]